MPYLHIETMLPFVISDGFQSDFFHQVYIKCNSKTILSSTGLSPITTLILHCFLSVCLVLTEFITEVSLSNITFCLIHQLFLALRRVCLRPD